MSTFPLVIHGFHIEVITDDSVIQSYGVPPSFPCAMVNKHTDVNFDGAVYVPSVFASLDSETQSTMLMHEVGHIACGHLELPLEDTLTINAKLEAEADAWAASKLSIERMDKMFDIIAKETMVALKQIVPTDVYDTIVEQSAVALEERKEAYKAIM